MLVSPVEHLNRRLKLKTAAVSHKPTKTPCVLSKIRNIIITNKVRACFTKCYCRLKVPGACPMSAASDLGTVGGTCLFRVQLRFVKIGK